jgi:tetratricopeptide (TPR) repeat protein
LDWNGKLNEYLRCYDRAIELKPKLAVAWMNRAMTLPLNLSLFSLAQANASQAIKLDPSLENESLQMTWNYIQAI